MIHSAKKRTLKKLLSVWLLAVFLITLVPFAAFHNHNSKEAVDSTEQIIKTKDNSGQCLICNYHFVKDFLTESTSPFLISNFTYKTYHPENVKQQLFNIALKQLRGPPSFC
ncbi:hypothetical protein NF867_10590 [Solitalea sp. MAHUQ-68]|uniref:Uncharacterized protein n=1 Tax=Solitalea agri TaxID=2953739 RepID=A0A9X2F7U2_9SPHI|nr:hypothetical protein [Solitalea agri]MCO4293313.1 hypothetical protein [Solitalea agri]